jgi:hypothetical protein
MAYMHREVWMLCSGCEALLIDHKNGNGLDNQFSNLRAATKAQNQMNSRSTRGYKGVRFSKRHGSPGRWEARIGIGGRYQHLGTFDTAEEAAVAYNAKAVELFGEFARLNEVATFCDGEKLPAVAPVRMDQTRGA